MILWASGNLSWSSSVPAVDWAFGGEAEDSAMGWLRREKASKASVLRNETLKMTRYNFTCLLVPFEYFSTGTNYCLPNCDRMVIICA